jgi:uncharacterized metal-binding protein
MPSGRRHDQITWFLLPVIGASSFYLTKQWNIVVAISLSFLFSGFMFGQDLDIKSVQYARWGILRWIWNPYQRSMRHRSFISHGPLIGTLVRLWYLLNVLVICFIVVALSYSLVHKITWDLSKILQSSFDFLAHKHLWELIASLVGLELGSMSHSVSDWLGSSFKKINSPKKKKKQSR